MDRRNFHSAIYIQPAVKKETLRISFKVFLGTLLMFFIFLSLHQIIPSLVPFNLKIIISGVLGTAIASFNFLFMGLTVQKVTAADTDDEAFKIMKTGYRFRTLGQLLWVLLALVLPFFNGAAGIIPLFIPGLCIKAESMLRII